MTLEDNPDLINFDVHGKPRAPEEIKAKWAQYQADIRADADSAFNETHKLRTAEEIARIKWERVLEKPAVQEFLHEAHQKIFRIYETTHLTEKCIPCNLLGVVNRLKDLRCQEVAHQEYSPAEKELVLAYVGQKV